MRFGYSPEQKAIGETARALLSARFPPPRVRELLESSEYDSAVWREVADLGWLTLAVPDGEDDGELGMVEFVAVQEQFGYFLAPLPFLGVWGAAMFIAHAGSPKQRARWLPELVSGQLRATVAFARSDGWALAPDVDGVELVIFVTDDGAGILEPGAFSVAPVELLDLTRRFGVITPHRDPEPLPGDAEEATARLRIAVAAESVGVAQRALDTAVDYAKTRVQFAHPIGSYQAVSHRCARMLLQVEAARVTTLHAAYAADLDPPALALASAVAKACASDAGWQVPSSAIQIHGGIGVTWEHDAHLLLRRGRVNAELLGPAREQRDKVADFVVAAARQTADKVAIAGSYYE